MLHPLHQRAAQGRVAAEQPPQGEVAAVLGDHRAGQAAKGRPVRLRVVRAAGDERRREALVAQRLAPLQDDRAGGVVDLGDGPARAALDGVVPLVVGVEVVLLRREREPVGERLLHDLGGRSVPLQAGDRLGVLDELLVGHLEPAEVPPPSRTRLAAVVVEELRLEPALVAAVRRLEEGVSEAGRLRELLGATPSSPRAARAAPGTGSRPRTRPPPARAARAASRGARAWRGSPPRYRPRCRRGASRRRPRGSARSSRTASLPDLTSAVRVKKNCSISFSE